MDAVSYSLASKQAQRIEKFIENPDSTSGIVTVPKTIASGENITIPVGRVAILPNVQIDGVLNIEGEVFIPSGATFSDLETQIDLKAPLENPAFTSGISTKDVNYKSTPVNITSWSYVGTTITLNAASHTFVAGDYIEVSGLTATTYPANGIQLITSVTSTTIVFTLGATPTGTAGVSSATVKGYTTINGRVSESIGVNQTEKIISLPQSTNRYNTTGKPIYVNVKIASTTAVSGVLYLNGTVSDDQYYNFSGGNNMSLKAIVSNGSYYSYSANGTGLAIAIKELS